MLARHWVRWGALGHVAQFASVDAARYARGARVVVRTERGLELGEILGRLDPAAAEAPHGGEILRRLTEQDRLLETRLLRNRDEAFEACRARLAAAGLDALLVDVEHLFDGRTLVFYFLGRRPPEADRLTEELAEAYDARVQFRAFSETVERGCGPDCGTERADGCGDCDSCCAVAAACTAHHRSA